MCVFFSAKVSNIASNAFTETSYRLVCTDKKETDYGPPAACCSVILTSYFRHPTSGNEVNVSPAAAYTRKQRSTCLFENSDGVDI